LEKLFKYFNNSLLIPTRMSRSSKPHAFKNAISWFKADSLMVGRARTMANILEQNGITVELLRTTRPGYVVYEDEDQVVAVPFRAKDE
jgi:hypothetical protein